jgi:hypothetical protein
MGVEFKMPRPPRRPAAGHGRPASQPGRQGICRAFSRALRPHARGVRRNLTANHGAMGGHASRLRASADRRAREPKATPRRPRPRRPSTSRRARLRLVGFAARRLRAGKKRAEMGGGRPGSASVTATRFSRPAAV